MKLRLARQAGKIKQKSFSWLSPDEPLLLYYWITVRVREYAHLWGIARGEWKDKRVGDFLFS
jgi:hypothetical protein